MKKALITTIAIIAFMTSTVFANTAITVRVNNQPIDLKDAAAFVDKSNRTLVPLRFIADNLDAQTDWDQQSKTATVTQGDKVIKLCIPCKKLTINGVETSTDSYGLIKNNRTYVPLRLIAEAFGAKVSYKNRVVDINTSQNPYNPNEYKDPDTGKMNKLDWSSVPKNSVSGQNKSPLYDGKGWNWNVRLIKEGVDTDGFGIRYNESTAGALYVVTTDGEWIRGMFADPGGNAFLGNHLGKEIDKVLFGNGKSYFLVDIDNFKVEK